MTFFDYYHALLANKINGVIGSKWFGVEGDVIESEIEMLTIKTKVHYGGLRAGQAI